jgi:D-alanyl-D-alanine carboxypeptidase
MILTKPHLVLILLLWPIFLTSSARADAIDDYIRSEMDKRRIPGLALAVVKDGAVVKMEGYGFANLEHEVPVTPDPVFELASVTKQFTASGIMTLVEDGKVELDAPIVRYLTDAPETWNGITVRHLLTHTSGLPRLEEGFKALRSDGARLNYTTKQMFDAAAKDKLDFAAGERFQYSDVGYFLLGMIIEKASGQKYREFLDTRFFLPLGMTATSVLDQGKVLKHRAQGYTIRDGELVNIRRVTQVELPSHYGVFSTVKDLVTWDAALAAKRVVKPSSLAQMWTETRLNDGSTFPYGFGWFVEERRGHRWINHTGITGTEFSRFPDDELTAIVLTNLGRNVGATSPVNPWGLTYGVAGRYIAGLLVGPQPAQPDPDVAMTQRLRETLEAVSRGEDPAVLIPALTTYLSPAGRSLLKDRFATVKSFTFVTCDDTQARVLDRHGARVSRICHYRLVNTNETRYYSFWLTGDARVADIWSSTE